MAHAAVPRRLVAASVMVAVCAAATPGGSSAAGPARGGMPGDTISGRLTKIVAAENGPYVVVSDLIVPQGKTVIIEPGTVLLFRNFAGLKVEGTLLARGTSEKPIVFTSINDRKYNPGSELDAAPYDWNGVYVYESGIGCNFSYCAFFYSVYGIISATKYIRIGPSVFSNNGRANLTIDGVEHEVGDGPYEYSLTRDEAAAQGIPLTILRDPHAKRRNTFRYGGLGVTFAGLIAGTLFTSRFDDSYDAFRALGETTPENLAAHSSREWENARSDARRDFALMMIGYGAAAVGCAGFVWSFTF